MIFVTKLVVMTDAVAFFKAVASEVVVGLYAQPYGVVFRKLICPRLSPPTELESAAPPRFAQLVGFLFAAVALIATLSGASVVAMVAIAFALAAAFLNAAFNFCLGCEMYLLGRRVLARG